MHYSGLTDTEVTEAREKHGSNVIPDSEPTTFWDEFKETFSDPMIKILLVIAGIMIVMFFLGYAEIFEPIGTCVAILVVAFVSAKTGVASDTAYRKTKASVKKDVVKTYRNGTVTEVVIDDIVVGDFVILQSGDKIPADGIVIDGKIKVNNASLNGESEDCKKKAAADGAEFSTTITGETFVDDSSLFRGAVVTDGECVCKICKVGTDTMMGKMAEEMQVEEPDSPLKVKLNDLAGKISKFGYCGAVVIAFCMLLYNIIDVGGFDMFLAQDVATIVQEIINAVSLAIVIIVCAVPEGLPLMISLVLMQNTKKLLEHNVLVRKAVGIETAGSLNILFSDKTGTITKGQLEVVEFFLADGTVTDFDHYARSGVNAVKKAIAQNTQSVYDSEHKVVGGNVTDKALLEFIGESEYIEYAVKGVPVVNSQAFNSANKFSQAQIGTRTYYKGAPERILAKAKKYVTQDGEIHDIDFRVLNAKIDQLAEKSMRVLAFGVSESEMQENIINDDIIVTGLVGIRDDVRPDAKEAIAKIKEAGIQLVMITGDRLETARAIAKDAGLITSSADIVLSSAELGAMSDDDIKKILPNIRVIARALPTDKSRMVRLSQELNLVTGMTGDGVNDSPALKLADVGFAMGSGTDVAKEASKIVILDDSLTSIADAIWYGRTIYHNILKFCNFQLVINVCAVVISAIAPFFGVNEPLKVTHLLFVNLVMDSLGALMLGNEPALKKYMTEKPRRRDESIISGAMAQRILIEAAWLIVISFAYLKLPFFNDFFYSDEEHITGYFVLFIVSALFNGFNVRDTGVGIFKGLNVNKNFVKIVGIIAVIQAAIVYSGYIPMFGYIGLMFSCVPIPVNAYAMVLILGATIIPIDIIRKVCFEKE